MEAHLPERVACSTHSLTPISPIPRLKKGEGVEWERKCRGDNLHTPVFFFPFVVRFLPQSGERLPQCLAGGGALLTYRLQSQEVLA